MTLEIDKIYDIVDKLSRENRFEAINYMLMESIIQNHSNPDILLAWLTSTLPIKNRIHIRTLYLELTKEQFPEIDYKGLE